MRNIEHERYRQILNTIIQNGGGPRLVDEPAVHADINEMAVVNHARYITDKKEQIRYGIRDAARRALARIEDGDFGECLDCGEPISPKRLMAIPWAECCVQCQSRREETESLQKAA